MCKSLIFTEFSNIANQIIAVKKSFRKQWPNGLYGIARTLNSASQPMKKRGELCFHLSTRQVREKGFLCSLCCSLISADNGGPVARGKAPFLCSFNFLTLKSRNFVKICFYFFCHNLNFISGENSPLKEMLSLQNHLFHF